MRRPYYVYELVDPRDNTVFYVGKGTGNRVSHHAIEAQKGGKSAKCAKIRKLASLGLFYRVVFVREFATENAAYNFEKRLINKRGLENLTNIFPGGRLEWEKKADVERAPFITRIAAAAIIINFTRNFTRTEVGGVKFPVSKLETQRVIGEFVEKCGAEWTIKQFAKHKITLLPPDSLAA